MKNLTFIDRFIGFMFGVGFALITMATFNHPITNLFRKTDQEKPKENINNWGINPFETLDSIYEVFTDIVIDTIHFGLPDSTIGGQVLAITSNGLEWCSPKSNSIEEYKQWCYDDSTRHEGYLVIKYLIDYWGEVFEPDSLIKATPIDTFYVSGLLGLAFIINGSSMWVTDSKEHSTNVYITEKKIYYTHDHKPTLEGYEEWLKQK